MVTSSLIQKTPLQLSGRSITTGLPGISTFHFTQSLPFHHTEPHRPNWYSQRITYTHVSEARAKSRAPQGHFRCDFIDLVAHICAESSSCRFKGRHFNLTVKLVLIWYLSLPCCTTAKQKFKQKYVISVLLEAPNRCTLV